MTVHRVLRCITTNDKFGFWHQTNHQCWDVIDWKSCSDVGELTYSKNATLQLLYLTTGQLKEQYNNI